MSSALQTIKNLLNSDGSDVPTNEYRCTDCGNEFTSAKDPERVQCLECLDRDVEKVD